MRDTFLLTYLHTYLICISALNTCSITAAGNYEGYLTGEDEGPDAGGEPREERVEGKGPDQAAVDELNDAGQHDVQ